MICKTEAECATRWDTSLVIITLRRDVLTSAGVRCRRRWWQCRQWETQRVYFLRLISSHLFFAVADVDCCAKERSERLKRAVYRCIVSYRILFVYLVCTPSNCNSTVDTRPDHFIYTVQYTTHTIVIPVELTHKSNWCLSNNIFFLPFSVFVFVKEICYSLFVFVFVVFARWTLWNRLLGFWLQSLYTSESYCI